VADAGVAAAGLLAACSVLPQRLCEHNWAGQLVACYLVLFGAAALLLRVLALLLLLSTNFPQRLLSVEFLGHLYHLQFGMCVCPDAALRAGGTPPKWCPLTWARGLTTDVAESHEFCS